MAYDILNVAKKYYYATKRGARMILKVRLTDQSRDSIARIKSIRFPDSGSGVRAGYIVGLAVDETASLSEDVWKAATANMYQRQRGEAASTSTSLTLRQSVYEKLCKARDRVEQMCGKEVSMTAVLELLLSMTANGIGRIDTLHTLRVMEWNINGRSGHVQSCLPAALIANQILKKSPHIFVLTEFVPTTGWSDLKALLADSFEVYASPYRPYQNGICIGLRRNCGITFLSEEERSFPKGPDFYRIKIHISGVDIFVIGTRIQVGSKLTESEFQSRLSQFCTLADYLVSLPEKDHVIALGDFNNARILGTGYETTQKEMEDVYTDKGGKGCLQIIYGYQKMKEELLKRTENTGMHLSLVTPEGSLSSVGAKLQDGEAVHPKSQYHKYDHVLTSLKGVAASYDWAFLEDYGEEQFRWGRRGWEIKSGFPDHAILDARLELPRQEAGNPWGPGSEERDCADADR